MQYTVGQQILNGQVTVVSVDTSALIVSVTIPLAGDYTGPAVISYNAGVTEALVQSSIEELYQKITG